MKESRILLVSALLAITVCGISPWLGPIAIGPGDIFDSTDTGARIFWRLRVPQVLLAFLVGASLGLSGMVYQALFRNPLATPYTLGVASGASFVAVLMLFLGVQEHFLGIPLLRLGGFVGALSALSLLFVCAGAKAQRSLASLLLIGVALGFMFSSLILLLQFMSSPTQGYIALRWLMGGLETLDYATVIELGVLLLLTSILIYRKHQELDLLAIDEDLAAARGVAVQRTQYVLIGLASVLVGAAVSIAGPIGFVGLIIPHAARLLVGPRHQILLPVVLLNAGCFLVLCDTAARLALSPLVLPVGVVTALLGGPLFLLLLMRSRAI